MGDYVDPSASRTVGDASGRSQKEPKGEGRCVDGVDGVVLVLG